VKAVAQEYQEQLLFFHVDTVGENAAVFNLLAVSEARHCKIGLKPVLRIISSPFRN
jgi:hypothetical protein